MYGPGSSWGYPPPPPPQVIYVPMPSKGKGAKGTRGVKYPPIDPISAIAKAQDDLDKLKKMFKEEKKDDKPKGRTFTLLETVGLQFILMLPTSFFIFLILKLLSR